MAWFRSLTRRLARTMGGASERDGRGRRLIAVIECILNQNARDAGAAKSPAMNREVVRLCQEYDVGLLQMPCPEWLHGERIESHRLDAPVAEVVASLEVIAPQAAASAR